MGYVKFRCNKGAISLTPQFFTFSIGKRCNLNLLKDITLSY